MPYRRGRREACRETCQNSFRCLPKRASQCSDQSPGHPHRHAATPQPLAQSPRPSASRRTPRRPPRASREHGASPHGACRERHFPGISAARNLHWSWEWLCSGSLHVGARSSHGRTPLLCASGTQGRGSRAAPAHEVDIENPWRKEGSEVSAPAGCSFREYSTSCGCAAEWSERAWS